MQDYNSKQAQEIRKERATRREKPFIFGIIESRIENSIKYHSRNDLNDAIKFIKEYIAEIVATAPELLKHWNQMILKAQTTLDDYEENLDDDDREIWDIYRQEFYSDATFDDAQEAMQYRADDHADFARQLCDGIGIDEIVKILEDKGILEDYLDFDALGDYFAQDYVEVESKSGDTLFFLGVLKIFLPAGKFFPGFLKTFPTKNFSTGRSTRYTRPTYTR